MSAGEGGDAELRRELGRTRAALEKTQRALALAESAQKQQLRRLEEVSHERQSLRRKVGALEAARQALSSELYQAQANLNRQRDDALSRETELRERLEAVAEARSRLEERVEKLERSLGASETLRLDLSDRLQRTLGRDAPVTRIADRDELRRAAADRSADPPSRPASPAVAGGAALEEPARAPAVAAGAVAGSRVAAAAPAPRGAARGRAATPRWPRAALLAGAVAAAVLLALLVVWRLREAPTDAPEVAVASAGGGPSEAVATRSEPRRAPAAEPGDGPARPDGQAVAGPAEVAAPEPPASNDPTASAPGAPPKAATPQPEETDHPPLAAAAGAAASEPDESTAPVEGGAEAGAPPAQAGPEPASAPPASSPDPAAATEAVRAWAAAWSEQRADDYLAGYSRLFVPPDGVSRAAWEATRRDRILKPRRISVTLSAVEQLELEPGKVRVQFDQGYESDTYRDRVRKTLILAWEAGAWRIVEERSNP